VKTGLFDKSSSAIFMYRWLMYDAGTEFKGVHVPPTFVQGGTYYLLSPQHFVIKNNVVVQISWLHYCCKRFPA